MQMLLAPSHTLCTRRSNLTRSNRAAYPIRQPGCGRHLNQNRSGVRAPLQAMSDISRLDCGPRLSEVTIHNKTVYLAGQVPEDVTKDIKGQTKEVLDEIDRLLARAGTDKSRILMAMVYVVDLSEFGGFNEVWDAWVAPGAAPCRATVQVTKLADPGWKLEIVVTAALP